MAPISKSTEQNWKKLHCDTKGKLTRRANKTRSAKRVVAVGYLDDSPARQLLSLIEHLGHDVGDIMYSLCLALLKNQAILDKSHVRDFLSTFPYHSVGIDIPPAILDSDSDVLGFIYQSLIPEGDRNSWGLYYTHRKVAEYIVGDKVLGDDETFLDPCCGSGAFLLSVKTRHPSHLYGFDIDPIAVMIAGTNLLMKYADVDFVPHVYCTDFLRLDPQRVSGQPNLPLRFDHIYTNPPWGVDKAGRYSPHNADIKTKERASMFLAESLRRLSDHGDLYFLLPTSLLKIKTHIDVRRYILSHSTIKKIDLFSDRFDGVFTDFFGIRLSCPPVGLAEYDVTSAEGTVHISLSRTDQDKGRIITHPFSAIDHSIISKMEARRHDDLSHSQWALGIVTGDNRSKVKDQPQDGCEPIYTGRQVSPFLLQETHSYIRFDPDSFQQCAREDIYRAPEKLIYRFIAKYPIVAYDDRQSLCLNSANILIPDIDGMSIKSVAALMNAALYHYYYSIHFTDIKVLKGNLLSLPFPRLNKDQDESLERIVTKILASGPTEESLRQIDHIVYAIFDISPEEQARIEEKLSIRPITPP